MVTTSRQEFARASAAVLNERFDRLIDIGGAIARRPRAIELLAHGDAAGAIEIFKDGFADFPLVEQIFVTDLSGTIVADHPHPLGAVGKNIAFRSWYQEVTRTWKPLISEVFRRTLKPEYNVIAIATPISKDDGTKLGILVLQVRLEKLLAWAKEFPTESSEILYVVDQKGQLAAHPKVSSEVDIRDFSKVPAVQKALQGEAGVEEGFDPLDQERELSSWAPVLQYHWAVVITEPSRVAFKGRDDYCKLLLLAYVVVFLAGGFLIIVITRSDRERRKTEELAREVATFNAELAERKKLEQEIIDRNRELETLLHVASHDLKEPLRAIENFCGMIAQEYAEGLNLEGKDLFGRVIHATQRLSRLLGDIVTLTRARQIEKSAVSIDGQTIVNEALARLEERVRETGAAVKLVGKFPSLCVDKTWAVEGLYNIISNALKYKKEGTFPEIEIASYRPQAGDPPGVGFAVRDRGPGVAPEHTEMIFELFKRAVGREVEGTGAGLAIVREIARRNGGRAWVKPREGGGSEFIVTFGA